MSEATIALVDSLVGRFPALEPLLREHLADNFGEVLPHVFFGDLTRYILSEFRDATESGSLSERRSARHVCPLLDELEKAFTNGTEDVRELIAVSFLENLPRHGEEGADIRDLLGSSLRSELERIG